VAAAAGLWRKSGGSSTRANAEGSWRESCKGGPVRSGRNCGTFWPAKAWAGQLIVDWDLGPNAALSTEQMLRDFTELAKNPGTIAKKTGDPESALKTAAKTITEETTWPYLAHAMMEPLKLRCSI